MKIWVEQVGFDFEREVERMVYLFYEDDVVTFFRHEDTELEIHLMVNESEWIASCVVNDVATGQEVALQNRIGALQEHQDPVRQRRTRRQAVLQVLYDALQKWTGRSQPWGILTGIRPMKLVHGMLEKGASEAEIRDRLGDQYRVSVPRIDLMMEIAVAERDAFPDLYNIDNEVSIYIGIPFCPTHCAYCTFPAYSMEEKHTYAKEFLLAMDKEFQAVGSFLRRHQIPVTSIYVGGGTPTSLTADEMRHMFESMYREIPKPWRELTVEAGRPDTITPDRVQVMREYGVNRVSVNPQTFKAETLKMIGRGHTPNIVDRRFMMVKEAGFENINMDIILGLPGEDFDDVRYTLERIKQLMPDSVTVHTMSFKRTAVVNREREQFQIPHSELVRMMMDEAQAWATGLGYRPYYVYRQKDILANLENIGYAMPGKESVYNIAIMEERQTIVGIGGGASTKLITHGGQSHGRHGNPREPKAYVDTIDQVIEKKIELLENLWTAHLV